MINLDSFIYKAAMSGGFSGVYSMATLRKKDNFDNYETVHAIRKYTRIDDFNKCVEISSIEHQGTAERDRHVLVRINQPRAFAAQLLAGRCVQATLMATHHARYKLSLNKGFLLIEDLVTGLSQKTNIRFLRDERLWQLFGLSPHEEQQLTNRLDPEQLDNLSLKEIERAIKGNRETQLAVLNLIADRLQVERLAGFQVKLIELRPTDPTVADLLIESGAFRSNDRAIRRAALRAAATMPMQKEKLIPEITSALTTDIIPKPLTSTEEEEKLRIELDPRGRDEVLRINRHLFENKSPSPGSVFPEIISAAGFAANRFGQELADIVVKLTPPHILNKLGWGEPGAKYDLGTLTNYNNTGLYLAFAISSNAEQRALDMLNRKPGESRRGRTAIEAFLATMPDMSKTVERVMFEKCDDAFEGKPSLLSSLFCNSMLAKRGDKEALNAIHLTMMIGNKKKQSLAVKELLLNHGTKGISILKEGLLNGDHVWNGMICHLGPKAGQDVVHYVRSVALASPDDKRFQNINKWCQRSMPTMLGMFAN